MAINVTVTPGKQFANNEAITTAGLNQLGQPTFSVTGALDNAQLSAGAVTPAKVTPGGYFYATAAHVAGVISFDLSPAMPAGYVAGAIVRWKQPSKNTGAVNLNVNSLGEKDLVRGVSGSQFTELAHGDLLPNALYEAMYDGTRFQLLTPISRRTVYTGTTAGTNAYTLTLTPAPVTSMEEYDQSLFELKFENASTAAATLQVGALGAVPIKRLDGTATVTGDIAANSHHILKYDHATASFYLQTAVAGFGDTATYGFTDLVLDTVVGPGGATYNFVNGSVGRTVFRMPGGKSFATSGTTINLFTLNTSATRDGNVPASGTKKWWYLFLITNGTTVQAFASENQVPVMPSGYVAYVLLAPLVADGPAFDDVKVRGRRVIRNAMVAVVDKPSTGVSLNTWTGLTPAQQDKLNDTVPTIAIRWLGVALITSTATADMSLQIANGNQSDIKILTAKGTSAGQSWVALTPNGIWATRDFDQTNVLNTFIWQTALAAANVIIAVRGYEY